MGNKCIKSSKKHVISQETQEVPTQPDSTIIKVQDPQRQENGQPEQTRAQVIPNGDAVTNTTISHPLPPVIGNETVVIAMYGYTAKHNGDLSFRKGEKLQIVEKNDPDWWTVKRLETGETGYIPSNYVGTTAIESEE